MDDGRHNLKIGELESPAFWAPRGIPVRTEPRKRRGRPPGIAPERAAALARLVKQGLSLGEIAKRLGVSRQCVHVQLRKCPDLEAWRRQARAARVAERAATQRVNAGWQALLSRGDMGKAIVRFLVQAQRHGWVVDVAPRQRPRVNGVPLAFHRPKTARPAGQGANCRAHYFHVRVTRREWLQVVELPTGRYVIWLPGTLSRTGSFYIPVREARKPTRWPEWPKVGAETLVTAHAA